MISLRNLFRAFLVIALLQLSWVAAALVPVEWFWFDPSDYYVSDGTADQVPTITFGRSIKRETVMSYHVTVRRVGETHSGVIVCDPTGGPFPYRPDAKLPKVIDLVWWSGGDSRCWPLTPGNYVSVTCWTAVEPFYGLVPPKTVCRRSNVFTIRP